MRTGDNDVNTNRAGRAAVVSLLALGAAILGAMVLAQGPPEADAKKKKPTPKVLCWSDFPPDFPGTFPPPEEREPPSVKRKPQGCAFFRRREPDDCDSCFGRIRTYELRWDLWEHGSAIAKGLSDDSIMQTGEPRRIWVKLTKPVRGKGCGGRVFSRVRVTDRGKKEKQPKKKKFRGPATKLYITC